MSTETNLFSCTCDTDSISSALFMRIVFYTFFFLWRFIFVYELCSTINLLWCYMTLPSHYTVHYGYHHFNDTFLTQNLPLFLFSDQVRRQKYESSGHLRTERSTVTIFSHGFRSASQSDSRSSTTENTGRNWPGAKFKTVCAPLWSTYFQKYHHLDYSGRKTDADTAQATSGRK